MFAIIEQNNMKIGYLNPLFEYIKMKARRNTCIKLDINKREENN